jgi:hypothetical protein
MKQNIPNKFRMVEHKHAIHLTNELIRCINKHAETEDDVLGFGRTIWQGFEYNTVYIHCNDGQTRQFFFDPETFDIREVESRTGITAAKAIKEIREIVSEASISAAAKVHHIEAVLEEVK